MRMAHFSAVAILAWLVGQPAFGQPSLSQIEQQIQGLRSPAQPADAGATNASGYLGAELDDEGEQGRGVRVKSVRLGAPADKSGLKANDLITAIDGKRITNLDDYDANAKRPAGAKLAMTIERDGRSQPLTVTLGPRPATASEPAPGEIPPVPPTLAPPGASSAGSAPTLIPPTGAGSPATLPAPGGADAGTRPGIVAQPQEPRLPASEMPASPGSAAPGAGGGASLGITVAPQSEQARAGSSRRRGALIAGVKRGSPADLAGLREGALIVQIDGRPINSDDDLVAAIRAARPGQEVELTYYEGDRLGRKAVRLAQAGAATASGPATSGREGDSPPRLGVKPGGGRPPLINRVEQLVDNFSRAQGGGIPTVPTVYDPQAMAVLQKSVADLITEVKGLEERLRAIENKQGGTSPAPQSPPPQAPGFGAPAAPAAGPGFGPPTGAGGTNP